MKSKGKKKWEEGKTRRISPEKEPSKNPIELSEGNLLFGIEFGPGRGETGEENPEERSGKSREGNARLLPYGSRGGPGKESNADESHVKRERSVLSR